MHYLTVVGELKPNARVNICWLYSCKPDVAGVLLGSCNMWNEVLLGPFDMRNIPVCPLRPMSHSDLFLCDGSLNVMMFRSFVNLHVAYKYGIVVMFTKLIEYVDNFHVDWDTGTEQR